MRDDELKYLMVDEKSADETEQLEEEELETAIEGKEDDEEEDEVQTPGQKFYNHMKEEGLVTDGDWEDIIAKIRQDWEKAAACFSTEDVLG